MDVRGRIGEVLTGWPRMCRRMGIAGVALSLLIGLLSFTPGVVDARGTYAIWNVRERPYAGQTGPACQDARLMGTLTSSHRAAAQGERVRFTFTMAGTWGREFLLIGNNPNPRLESSYILAGADEVQIGVEYATGARIVAWGGRGSARHWTGTPFLEAVQFTAPSSFEPRPFDPNGNQQAESDFLGNQNYGEGDELWIEVLAPRDTTDVTSLFGLYQGVIVRGADDVYGTRTAGDCRHPIASLAIDMTAFLPGGEPLAGGVLAGDLLDVDVRLRNTGSEPLTGLTFPEGAPLVIDPRSPGGTRIVSAPSAAPPTALALGQTVVLRYRLMMTAPGLAALNARVSASGATTATAVSDKRSLRLDIADGPVVDAAMEQLVAMQAMDRYMVEMYDRFVDQMAARGNRLKRDLKKVLSPAEFRRWFSGGASPTDRARAAQQGVAPELIDARLPGKNFKGYTVEELNDAYDTAFADEVGEGVSKWATGWKKLGRSAKNAARAAYGEALLSSYYMLGNATPQERMEFESKMIAVANASDRAAVNLVSTVRKEAPRWRENGTYFAEAVEKVVDDALLRSPDLQGILAQEKKARQNLLKLADTDPVRFQQQWAKRDAEIFNVGVPLILDTVLGGGVARLGGAVITKTGVGVARSGEALGVVKNGQKVKAAKTGVPITGEGGLVAADRTAESFLKNVDGATMVRASDQGNIYKLPNAAGVPEVTMDVKAGILKELEAEYTTATGKNLDLVEVLKPGSEYRKPNGVAKLELTEQKTGKPAMLDAGAPPDVLGEAAVWRNPVSPDKTAQYRFWNKARQQTAMKEWRKANDEWAKWQNPDAGSKTARLKQCIGQECLVPLDPKPWPGGLQRFVEAEYETVRVTQGKAEGLLIRVKSYKVVTKVNGKTVNTKTVVKKSDVGRPQTPDADAVAMAKQVGVDAQGRPKVAPLTRAEREFVMQRYVDKNIKARKAGLLPDAAEHGVTLVLDDASAKAAGKLLPAYGVPFLPEGAGKEYLRRIAKFVAPPGVSTDEMYAAMLKIVESDGGFGQYAVVLTKDSRYLGEIPVSTW